MKQEKWQKKQEKRKNLWLKETIPCWCLICMHAIALAKNRDDCFSVSFIYINIYIYRVNQSLEWIKLKWKIKTNISILYVVAVTHSSKNDSKMSINNCLDARTHLLTPQHDHHIYIYDECVYISIHAYI